MVEALGNTATVDAARSEGIVTPEAVVLDVETAGLASRVIAALLDLGLSLLIAVVLLLVGAPFIGSDDSLGATYGAIVLTAVIFGYPILFETWLRGRTPGKAALQLRAVTVDGAPIRFRQATLRAMGGIVDRWLPPGGITGALFIALTPRHQRVGDLIAGTIVIRDPTRYVLTPALWFSPPPGYEPYAASIDPSSITVEQYTVVRSFLTRGATLAPEIRYALAIDLADRLARSVRHPIPQWVHPEAFLVCAMARYQRRNGPGVARWNSGGWFAATTSPGPHPTAPSVRLPGLP